MFFLSPTSLALSVDRSFLNFFKTPSTLVLPDLERAPVLPTDDALAPELFVFATFLVEARVGLAFFLLFDLVVFFFFAMQ